MYTYKHKFIIYLIEPHTRELIHTHIIFKAHSFNDGF